MRRFEVIDSLRFMGYDVEYIDSHSFYRISLKTEKGFIVNMSLSKEDMEVEGVTEIVVARLNGLIVREL